MPTRKDLASAIRILAMDAVEKAKSGHPGAPLGMADMAEVLWNDFLKHNPADPAWVDRDRFVLSNGHASMLLYAALHLSGYELSTIAPLVISGPVLPSIPASYLQLHQNAVFMLDEDAAEHV